MKQKSNLPKIPARGNWPKAFKSLSGPSEQAIDLNGSTEGLVAAAWPERTGSGSYLGAVGLLLDTASTLELEGSGSRSKRGRWPQPDLGGEVRLKRTSIGDII